MSIFVKTTLLVTIIIFSLGFYYFNGRIAYLEQHLPQNGTIAATTTPQELVPSASATPAAVNCGDECREFIKLEVKNAIAGESATLTPKPVAVSSPPAAKKTQQVTYIPLGSGSTTSTDWVDVAGAQTYIDLAEYSANPYVAWEATLKIANTNGKAYARLYDATHGIAVNGSEVSVETGSYSVASSGRIYLWSGKNLYKVQIKSQTSEAATLGSGRIKIVY